jgi:hypothetical protein
MVSAEASEIPILEKSFVTVNVFVDGKGRPPFFKFY